jgi:endonuclease-8
MPEGDTIRRLADDIDRRFVGAAVVASTFRHPRLATLDLAGRRLVGTAAHGKHLFVRFDDGTSLHVHLLMQGRVRFGRVDGIPDWRRRFELVLRGGNGRRSMVGVDIPLLHHLPTDDESAFVGHLGPDVCAPGGVDLDVATSRLADLGDAELGRALLDQRAVAGFGNIYAVEVPFVCGVSPLTPVAHIDGLDDLVAIGVALIRTNAERGPQNTTGRRLATDDHWVLPGGVRRCPVCGEGLHRRSGAESPWRRRTAWCPHCQPDDDVTVDGERARRLLALHPALRCVGRP